MPKPTLIYDGDCGVCLDSVYWLEKRGATRTLVMRSYHSAPPQMALAGLTPTHCQKSAYVVDDSNLGEDCVVPNAHVEVYRGAGAVNFALRTLPGIRHVGWRLLGSLYLVPGLRQIEDVGYAWFARNRHRFGSKCCDAPSHQA